MNILLTINDFSITGGAERVVANLANAFTQLGHRVEILSFYHANSVLPYDTKTKLTFMHDFAEDSLRQKMLLNPLKKLYFKNLHKLILSLKVSFCHKHADTIITNDWTYMPLLKRKNAHYIKIHHSKFEGRYNTRNNLFDTLIILSAAELDIWQRYHNNVRIIPNFLPQIPTQSTDYKQKVVLSVGRMDNGDQKGFLRLIDIWKMVQESIKNPPHPVILSETQCSEVSKPRESNKNDELRTEKRFDELDSTLQRSDSNSLDSRTLDSSLRATLCAQNDNLDLSQWKLIIVGDGILKDEIETKIKALNLQDSIILKPFTKEIEKEYLSASIYAMSSHFEGFPMVLIESTSYGLAPISFDIKTGPSDIIADNQSGFLVKDNDLQDYADKLITLMSDENLRANFGKKAKTLVSEKFSKEVVIKLWEKVFDEMKR